MSIVLLRKLTRKSIIGFGDYKDLCVQNLIDLNKHKELLSIYYNCRNIDFAEDILKELHITGDRLINKKEKSEKRYQDYAGLYINLCLRDIIDDRTEHQNKIVMGQIGKMRRYELVQLKTREKMHKSSLYSRGSEMARVRGNYKRGNI